MRRFRIHHRIALPFVLLALGATVVAALTALSLVSRAINERVEAQLDRASLVVMRSDFALNPAILRLVQEIAGAEIVTCSADGAVLASTLDQSEKALLDQIVAAARPFPAANTPQSRRLQHAGTPYTIVTRAVTGHPGTVVVLARNTLEVAEGIRTARNAILATAAASLLVLTLMSRVIARRVADPIEKLLDVTRDVSAGTLRRAPESLTDEMGTLGRAFNEMLDRLDRSQDALLRSEKLAVTGLLAARVAHDVRNPLSSIKMQTQMLRSRLRGQDDNQALIASILRDIGQVENVIRGLLELARPGELKLTPSRLNEVVEDVLVQMMPQLTHNKIAIETAFDPNLPDVPLDVERFRRALLNLISNAAEAMPGGGTLSVTTALNPADSSVMLDVSDDGTGVDPAIAQRAFDPFVSTKHDGVGLGLVNTRAVVESHGGRVELAPRQGRGTRARVTLPGVKG